MQPEIPAGIGNFRPGEKPPFHIMQPEIPIGNCQFPIGRKTPVSYYAARNPNRKLPISDREQKYRFLCSRKLLISGLEFPVRDFWTGNPGNFRSAHPNGNLNRKLFSLVVPHIYIYTHQTKATNRTPHPHTQHTVTQPQHQKAHTAVV